VDEVEARLVSRVTERLNKLLNSGLGATDYLLEAVDVEVAVVYAALTLRVAEEWLRWEAACKDHVLRLGEAYCGEVERSASSGDPGQGVVSYFNTELKRMLIRIVRDFAPFPELPPWVVFYSTFRLREPVVVHLARLGPGEQLLRVPAFAAITAVLDAAVSGLEEHYKEKRADIASTTATYIYWELVRPLALFADAVERLTDARRASSLRARIKETTRRRGSVSSVGEHVAALHRVYTEGIIARMRSGAGRAGST